MRNPVRWMAEQVVDVSRTWNLGGSWSALRSALNVPFFHRPPMSGTTINYNLSRSLYRNDNPQFNLGAGFVRPIIDLSVEYVGIPSVTSDNGVTDSWLNECIKQHWAPQLQQVWRDAIRDSKTVVRYRQPSLINPLFTEEDRMHGKIDCIPPEMVDLQYDPTDPELLILATIHHFYKVDERTDQEIARGDAPRLREHEIVETITPDEYRFYDKTENRELTSWRTTNVMAFVPLWPCYNEYDAALEGGQSDIEPVLPFIQAFHEVLLQTLGSHKYHSSPKATFKLKDVYTFLQNNFPHVLDESGKLIPTAKVELTGREMYLLNVDEDAGFIEAKNVLGGSKELLDFLIDCICIAAETPKWAILKDQGAQDKDATVQPFEKKINRKRVSFEEFIVMLCKMALASTGKRPVTVRVTWPALRISDLAAKAQAVQQIVMALDIATLHRWIADETAIQIISELWPEVNSPEVEQKLAATNYEPPVPAPAPASPTQGSQNGKTTTKAAKSALATAGASNS